STALGSTARSWVIDRLAATTVTTAVARTGSASSRAVTSGWWSARRARASSTAAGAAELSTTSPSRVIAMPCIQTVVRTLPAQTIAAAGGADHGGTKCRA